MSAPRQCGTGSMDRTFICAASSNLRTTVKMTAITAVSVKSNTAADRYRLTKEQILGCCATGYDLGFRTFVLQGGEDGFYTDDRIADIVRTIKASYPDLRGDALDRRKKPCQLSGVF